MMDRNVPDFDLAHASFEVDQAAIPVGEADLYLEFHHAKEPRAAAMAAYIMGKLHRYAIRFNLVPR